MPPAIERAPTIDGRLELSVRQVSGTWRERELRGPGVLRLQDDTMEVVPAAGPPLSERCESLSGASWRTGMLTVHAPAGVLRFEGADGLDRAWLSITTHACPLPEFTRALRALGSRRGGDLAVQSRFFGPLIQARRQLEAEIELERRCAAFAGDALLARLTRSLEALAAEQFPRSAPHRRALAAELSEVMAPLFAGLRDLTLREARFREATDERRFEAWRAWTAQVGVIFADADRSWSAAWRLFQDPGPHRRRRRWWRSAVVTAVALGATAAPRWL